MQCENDFCIYWASGNCILEEVSLNGQGVCQECILVEIAENVLKAKRKKLLLRYQQEYQHWGETD